MFSALNYAKKFFDFLKGLMLSLVWVSVGASALLIIWLHVSQLNNVFGELLAQAKDLRLSQD